MLKLRIRKYGFHYLIAIVTLTILIISIIFNLDIFSRFIFSLKFSIESIGYYFQKILLMKVSLPETPANFILNNNIHNIMTIDTNIFLLQLEGYFKMLINPNYLLSSFKGISNITIVIQIFILIMVMILLAAYLASLNFETPKDPAILGKRKDLLKYLKIKDKILKPISSFLRNFIFFLKNNKYYLFIIGLIILFFSNLINLTLETIGYLFLLTADLIELPQIIFYFLFSTITTLYNLFVKLPLIIWLLIILIGFLALRFYLAKNKIYKLDTKNEEFCEECLGVANLTTGVMESGKDSFNTQVVITMQRVFKRKLKENLNYYRALFDDFNFKKFEDYIDEAKEKGVYDISLQIRLFFNELKDLQKVNDTEAIKNLCSKNLFSTAFLNYKKTVFNHAEPIDELQMMSDYAQSYFLYNDETPNVYSNIAMRLSYQKENRDYFSNFDFDCFKEKDINTFKTRSHFSKIWQFDTWRLGLRFNKNTGLSDCGIYNLSEGGKERGNMLTNAGKERKAIEPNQKNDDFNKYVKLLRHVYTIHYYPFVILLMNDQRVQSINADLNELFETIINLKKVKKIKNALLFYNSIEKTFLDIFLTGLNKLLDKYRETRNYTSLFYYFVVNLTNYLTLHKAKCENYFNYKKVDMTINQSGIQLTTKKEFFLIYKEVYAGAYATDCYFRFFEPLIEKRDNRTFNNGEYSDKYASIKEFEKQNSLLVKDIEDCNAFKPVLSDEEFKEKYFDPIKEAISKFYPDRTLKDIFTELHNKYGVEFKGYKNFCKFVKTNKLLPQKVKKGGK